MECKKCKKECLESELYNGFCEDCIKKYKNDTAKLQDIRNPIANYFKVWAIITIIAGIILGLVSLFANQGILSFLAYICISLVIATFFRAFAEIIQLLEDIKNKNR